MAARSACRSPGAPRCGLRVVVIDRGPVGHGTSPTPPEARPGRRSDAGRRAAAQRRRKQYGTDSRTRAQKTRIAPFHRWLPVRCQAAVQKTPIAQTENGAFGGGWRSWAIAAQQHYSIFDNLGDSRKNVYYLQHGSTPKTDAIWDNTGERISINFLALRGETVLDHLDRMQANGNDEAFLGELPKGLNKRKRHLMHQSLSEYAAGLAGPAP